MLVMGELFYGLWCQTHIAGENRVCARVLARQIVYQVIGYHVAAVLQLDRQVNRRARSTALADVP